MITEVGANNVAAIIAEPIQGEGGFIVPPAGYLKAVQEFAHEHGIVFIADEIQTGLGRTGAMFACEHEGVVPDLITTAKALGGGMPLSAVTGRAELMDAVPAGGLGGTYAGNPVACAAALGALETIEREQLVRKAQQIEAAVMRRLGALAGADSVVGEVRGRGAMLAVEFVQPGTREPAPADGPPGCVAMPQRGCPRTGLRHVRQRHPAPAAAGHQPRTAVGWPGRARTRHQGGVVTITSYNPRTGQANGTVEEMLPARGPSCRRARVRR